MITKSSQSFQRFAWVGLVAALTLAAPRASAQEKQFQLSEKVSEAVQKLSPLQTAKNWPAMMELVDSQLKAVSPTSYDAAFLLDMKAKIYVSMATEPGAAPDLLSKAIPIWEEYIKISEAHGYFDKSILNDTKMLLASVMFQDAIGIKDKAVQHAQINRAAGYLKDYMANAKKVQPEVLQTYATIIFYQATADPARVNEPENQALLQEATKTIEQAMLSSVRPKDTLYMLLLAIIEQQNEPVRSTEVMELMLKQYPNKKDMWPMLFSRYYSLGAAAKEGSKTQRDWFARAIVTVERAQALGFMNTPKDNYNLFTMYAGAGQIGLATDFLYNGMKKGTIESLPEYWRQLAQLYQYDNKELQAISTLKEATALFPKDGNFEYQMGQIYGSMEKPKEARDAYERAIKKGNLEKPHQVYLLLAYTQLELKDYDTALKTINQALAMPEGAKDAQVKTLKHDIETMMAEAKAAQEAREAAAKKL